MRSIYIKSSNWDQQMICTLVRFFIWSVLITESPLYLNSYICEGKSMARFNLKVITVKILSVNGASVDSTLFIRLNTICY